MGDENISLKNLFLSFATVIFFLGGGRITEK